jgi:hypothetical protein
MIITHLHIQNLRCLRDLQVPLDPLTALLGRNGVGKSCILHAIDIFYDTDASISQEDFYNREINQPIEITVSYGHLRPDELEEFRSYLSHGTLTVTKRISMQDGAVAQRYFAATPQVPRFAEVRAIPGARDRSTTWNAIVDSQEFPGLRRVKSAAEVEAAMRDYEASHPELLQPIEREEQFFGPPNVGGGKLDNYTKFVLIPAVRDVADELAQRRGSSLYQLLDLIVLRRIEARDDIAQRRSEIQDQVKDLYRPANLPELHNLGADISTLLARFSPGAQLVLDWDEPPLPDLPLPSAKPRLVEDDFEGDIDKKGHGLQRALLMTLLQYLAQLRESSIPEADTHSSEEPQQAAAAPPGPSLILAIEEPELYLHPLRARYLATLFTDLTRPSPEGQTYSNQIVFSSHSPHFVDLRRFEAIRVIRKQQRAAGAVPEAEARLLSIPQALREMARVAGLNQEQVTIDSFKARIIPVMGSTASEGFFADALMLVEGPGDAGIMSSLQELLGKNWLTAGIAIVPTEGKNNLDRPAIIFRGIGIPAFALFDGDRQHQGKGTDKEDNAIKANHLLLRLVGVAEVDFPPTQVNPTWAVFEYDIEHELRVALTEPVFDNLRETIATEYGLDRPSQVLNNRHSASAFITLAYQQGHSVPILEQVVQAVSNMIL